MLTNQSNPNNQNSAIPNPTKSNRDDGGTPSDLRDPDATMEAVIAVENSVHIQSLHEDLEVLQRGADGMVRGMMPHGRHSGLPNFPYVSSGPFVTDPVPAVEVQTLPTGAKRGTDHADCFLHMIPPEAMYAYGRAFAEGAKKYGEHNWLKGFPYSGLVNHAMHHLMKILEGDMSEDHIGHCLWNIGSLAYFMKHRPDLNDLPPYKKHEQPQVDTEPLPL